MARIAPQITLADEEAAKLRKIVSKQTEEYRKIIRAKIVLMASEGVNNEQISEKLEISKQAVCKWRSRFQKYGMEGLNDLPGRGRPQVFDMKDRLKIITEACNPPNRTTHWSIRDLKTHMGKKHSLKMSKNTVHRILKSTDLKPHQYEMWCNSQDPDFETKQIDVIGLYMNPPENVIVLCIDEKTGIQALGRKYHKSMTPGYSEKISHEYVRHGTKSLIAAFLVHKGEIFGKCYDRHRHIEFLDFLEEIRKKYPRQELRIIVDNLSTHKHPEVKKWLKKRNGRIKFHFTPTHASWLNQIELWFSILSRKVLKRGIFNSRDELVKSIMAFIKEYNKEAKPFRWTYTGEHLKI